MISKAKQLLDTNQTIKSIESDLKTVQETNTKLKHDLASCINKIINPPTTKFLNHIYVTVKAHEDRIRVDGFRHQVTSKQIQKILELLEMNSYSIYLSQDKDSRRFQFMLEFYNE